MDQSDIINVITNGKYYYPAINRHLVPFDQDTVICSICRNNKDNTNYYDVFLKDTQRIICQTCCSLKSQNSQITYKNMLFCIINYINKHI